jgi:hypothetical protein
MKKVGSRIPPRPFFSLTFSALALPPKKKMGQKETRQSLLEKIFKLCMDT